MLPMQGMWVQSLVEKDPVCQMVRPKKKRKMLYIDKLCELGASQVVLVVKQPPASSGDIRDAGSISWLGRFPGGGNGTPLQDLGIPWWLRW